MATPLPSIDFETYSEAGYVFDPEHKAGLGRWTSLENSNTRGLSAVGAWVYSEHPSTEVLCVAYNLLDGAGPRLWAPGLPQPRELFAHVVEGGLLRAFNSFFEFAIWQNVLHRRHGWPALPLEQLRCAMAMCRGYALPGRLGKAAAVAGVESQKMAEGTALLRRFSVPRQPSKNNPATRNALAADPENAGKLFEYCLADIAAEAELGVFAPDLSPFEHEVWQLDQRVNVRGIAIDTESLRSCAAIVAAATARDTAELQRLTAGAVQTVNEVAKLTAWLKGRGVSTDSVDKASVELLLGDELPPDCRRVLEIRQSLGAASVKKLHALSRQTAADGRVRDLFTYCGADRTGRWAGRGPQPQNLTKAGAPVAQCTSCERHQARGAQCVYCRAPLKPVEWTAETVADALDVIARGNLSEVERVFGDAIATVSGCLRGLFVAAPGHELICSDYSAIEAVVLACLAGEQWRIDVFNTHGKIYEMSAAKITGTPFEQLLEYKAVNGEHHPLRAKIGKVAELASGYQGWVGAWRAFGADEHFANDDEIAEAVKAWRRESPMIAGKRAPGGGWEIRGMWGSLEDAAHNAVKHPGQAFEYRGIAYQVHGDALFCRLPSGRLLTYHNPRLEPGVKFGKRIERLTFWGWNSDSSKGPVDWIKFDTYGGKLCENVVQSVSRDILAHAMVRLEAAGYPIVMHVHDEVVSEVPAGAGSIDEFERIMGELPEWAAGWPVRASGGWRGRRYRKD